MSVFLLTWTSCLLEPRYEEKACIAWAAFIWTINDTNFDEQCLTLM